VSTVAARQQDIAVTLGATGAVTPLASVEVRPQLTSVIDKVHIREGQFVKAGDLLFTLDARTNEAMVAQAQAQVAKDQATLADAQRQLARSRELLAQNFISQGQVDANQAAVDSAAALVQADRAALAAARVSQSYARVTAPSAGRVGAINVYPGTAVQANTTPLLTITQLQPIAVAFSLPQRHLGDALAALPGGGAPVSANLPDGGATREGRLKFVDNQVDAASGTVKVKAVFDNADGKLWPGAFVSVKMTARTLRGAVVVPQASIIQASRGDIVYVVQNGQASARPVQVAYSQGDDAVVSGVKAGERIVLEGRQNLRPGAAVVERNHEGGSAVAASDAQSKASAP
jgi:RND family efflux transporter MFP subunit